MPDLTEQGRRLASQRDDLIAQGANPADLVVPLHPDTATPARAHRRPWWRDYLALAVGLAISAPLIPLMWHLLDTLTGR